MSLNTRSNGPLIGGTTSSAEPVTIRTRFETPVRSKLRRAIFAAPGSPSPVTSSPSGGSARASHVPEYPIAVPSSRIRRAPTERARMWRRDPSAWPTIGQSSSWPCFSTASRASPPRFASWSMYSSIGSYTMPVTGIPPSRGLAAVQAARDVVEVLRLPLQPRGLLLELGRLQPHPRGLRADLRGLRPLPELLGQVPRRSGPRHGGREAGLPQKAFRNIRSLSRAASAVSGHERVPTQGFAGVPAGYRPFTQEHTSPCLHLGVCGL